MSLVNKVDAVYTSVWSVSSNPVLFTYLVAGFLILLPSFQMTSSTKEPKLFVVAGCLRGITALLVNFTKTMEDGGRCLVIMSQMVHTDQGASHGLGSTTV